jgi:hypothetical protein
MQDLPRDGNRAVIRGFFSVGEASNDIYLRQEAFECKNREDVDLCLLHLRHFNDKFPGRYTQFNVGFRHPKVYK